MSEGSKEFSFSDVLVWIWEKRRLILGWMFLWAFLGLVYDAFLIHKAYKYRVVAKSAYILVQGRFNNRNFPSKEIAKSLLEKVFAEERFSSAEFSFKASLRDKESYVIEISAVLPGRSLESAKSKFSSALQRFKDYILAPYKTLDSVKALDNYAGKVKVFEEKLRGYGIKLPPEAYNGLLGGAINYDLMYKHPVLISFSESQFLIQGGLAGAFSYERVLKYVFVVLFFSFIGLIVGVLWAGVKDVIAEAKRRL